MKDMPGPMSIVANLEETSSGLQTDAKAKKLHQVAAFPLRRGKAGYEACLVTTRETRRWTIPKGWPIKGCLDCDAAATEARQEGGLVGKVRKRPFGSYLYWKRLPAEFRLVEVAVYRLDVKRQLVTWKESAERYVMWFPLAVAGELVFEPGLKSLFTTMAHKCGASSGG